MSHLISHFYPGGTQQQYEATVGAVHPPGGLPPGQTYHFAGPTDAGFLVVAVWDSQESFDQFVQETLLPSLGTVEGGFAGPPEARTMEVTNQLTG